MKDQSRLSSLEKSQNNQHTTDAQAHAAVNGSQAQNPKRPQSPQKRLFALIKEMHDTPITERTIVSKKAVKKDSSLRDNIKKVLEKKSGEGTTYLSSNANPAATKLQVKSREKKPQSQGEKGRHTNS